MQLNIVYNEECIEGMNRIDDHSIDMILCDLPYGTTACKWDTIIPFDSLWKQYKRIIKKNGAIVLFGSEPFSSLLRTSNLSWFKYDWYWKKSKGSNFPHAKNMPLKIIETISIFSNGIIAHSGNRMAYNPQGVQKSTVIVKQNPNTSELKYHRESQSQHREGYLCQGANYPTTLIMHGSEGKSIHPTQKPVALCEYLIKTYSNEHDVILDNCMGSGTTAIACMSTNRSYIGYELDAHYYQVLTKRIQEHATKRV